MTHREFKGRELVNCTCEYGCNCHFNALPDKGHCYAVAGIQIDQGHHGDTKLDGLRIAAIFKWPGAIHEGNGEALILVDERANDRQRAAIAQLIEGNVGGPWGVLAWTWPKKHGPMAVPYEVDLKGVGARVKAGTVLEVESSTIKNPVNGNEAHPGIVLPEGIIVKQADLGCSKVFRITEGVAMDHSGQYTAVGPFDYVFP